MGTAIEAHSKEPEGERTNRSGADSAAAERAADRRAPGVGSPFRIVKPGQGIHVRWGTAIGSGVLALAGAKWVYEQTVGMTENLYVRTLVPVVFLVAVLYVIFWFIGRYQATVDFMIATEGEMKKVNWSTRKEVWGSTKVVIVSVLALGVLLAVVDALFMLLFGAMDVLKNVRILQLFSGTGDMG